MSTFVAIDFETANHHRDSACAVGLAAGHDGRIVLAQSFLIRPPTPQFTFTGIHGLRWEDVCDAPTFGELWPTLFAWFNAAEFFAAHNAPFDQSVLQECCARYRLRAPRALFTCTVQLARAQWGIYPTKLPDVCLQIRIPLRHHDSGSDAAACARIVLAAEAEGWQCPGTGCLREGAKSYAKPVAARRRGPSTPVQEARTFWPCSRNWPCGPTYL